MTFRVQARTLVLVVVVAAAVTAVFFVPPVPQDPAYHHFADHRALLGIPNFWNVISNLPFLLVGLLGLRTLARGELVSGVPELRAVYWTFFAGVSAIAFGSGYYHWAPSNATLVWDRLPMTVAFMAFFSAIVGERISADAGRRALLPLLALGVGSVVYWHVGELHGSGDLRPYAVVQFLPMLLIPLILILYPAKMRPSGYLWAVLLLYGLSKFAELWDAAIFHELGSLSGHSIKHLLAALGTYCFVLALRRRHAVANVLEPASA